MDTSTATSLYLWSVLCPPTRHGAAMNECVRWRWWWGWGCAKGGGGSQLARRSGGSTRLLVSSVRRYRQSRTVQSLCSTVLPLPAALCIVAVPLLCRSIVVIPLLAGYCTSSRISLLQGESVAATSTPFSSWPLAFRFMGLHNNILQPSGIHRIENSERDLG